MLLDLDGTIIDYLESAAEVWQGVCAVAAPTIGVAAGQLYAAIATAADWFWADPDRGRAGRADLRAASREIVQRALAQLEVSRSGAATTIADAYRDRRDRFTLLPGALDALETLRASRVALGLLTNGAGPVQREKIDRFGLARFFDCILIEGELGFGKPDERIYQHAMATLGSVPAETWMVGDDLDWEVAAPQRLGIHAIWVDSADRGLPAGAVVQPDHVVRSLAELVGAYRRPTIASSLG